MNLIKMDIPQDFYKEEIRCDYVVSRAMKEVWAIELDLLNELIKVCDKYNIEWCVVGGTLIGAMRHDGYIPWDDDIDIMMSRSNYNKLCGIAKNEFKDPYFFQNIQSDYGFRPFARLRNSFTTGIQKREVGAKIPYNQGIFIDIFPWDNLPDETYQRNKFIKRTTKLRSLAVRLNNSTFGYVEGKLVGIKSVIKAIFAPMLRWIFLRFKIRNPFWLMWEREIQRYKDIDSKEVALMYFYDSREKFVWTSKELKEFELKQFEMLNVFIPKVYNSILTKTYGNWREFVRGTSLHGEMFFDVHRTYKEYIDDKKRVDIYPK